MPRLMGIDIPDNKRIEISLRYIHGIGPARAARVLEVAKIDPGKRANTLSADEIRAIIDAPIPAYFFAMAIGAMLLISKVMKSLPVSAAMISSSTARSSVGEPWH